MYGSTPSRGRGQVRELSSSDLLSRVRDGYTSAQTQSKELHEQQVATLKEELDVVRHDSEAKVDGRRGGGGYFKGSMCHTCMCVCACASVCVCVCVCVHLCVCLHLCVCVHLCVCMHLCVCVHLYVCASVCMYICVCVHLCVQFELHVHVHIRAAVLKVCVCVCVSSVH